MMEYCQNHPDVNFIGMDIRFKRTYNLMKRLSKLDQINFRFLRAKGERIEFLFGESEVDQIFYFFPDPWPKKRHWKKRLFKDEFLKVAHRVLVDGGKLLVKTDHDGYAEWMEEVIANSSEFECRMKTRDLREEFPDHFLSQHVTKFEKIFLKQNIPIKAFELVNKKKEGLCH